MPQPNPHSTIAFLGLGAMGSRMARRLLDAGYKVVVWNRSPGPVEELVAAGARAAGSAREAVAGAGVVISMLTDDGASRGVWLAEEHGAAAGLRAGAVVVESSTVTPGWVKELAAAVGERGARFLEAPVLGSRPQAEAGQLVYLIGGSEADLETVRELLEVLGSRIQRVGEVGSAAVAKLAINTYFATQVASLGEVVGVLRRAGHSLEEVRELFHGLSVLAPALAANLDAIAAQRFAPLFPIDLVEKDLGYFLSLQPGNANAPSLAERVHQAYARAQELGFGSDNIAGVAKIFDEA